MAALEPSTKFSVTVTLRRRWTLTATRPIESQHRPASSSRSQPLASLGGLIHHPFYASGQSYNTTKGFPSAHTRTRDVEVRPARLLFFKILALRPDLWLCHATFVNHKPVHSLGFEPVEKSYRAWLIISVDGVVRRWEKKQCRSYAKSEPVVRSCITTPSLGRVPSGLEMPPAGPVDECALRAG